MKWSAKSSFANSLKTALIRLVDTFVGISGSENRGRGFHNICTHTHDAHAHTHTHTHTHAPGHAYTRAYAPPPMRARPENAGNPHTH